MTIDSTIILPEPNDRVISGDANEMRRYQKQLIVSLQQMYETLAYGINGHIRGSVLDPSNRWTPIVKDTANSGTTFTYDHQVGWVYRQGIIVDCWFDVEWTTNSGAITGNMYVELPYQVSVTDEMPFVGTVQPSVFTFTGGTECVINAISDTYRGEIWNTGDAFTTANQGSVAAGHLIGHIRYIGKNDE